MTETSITFPMWLMTRARWPMGRSLSSTQRLKRALLTDPVLCHIDSAMVLRGRAQSTDIGSTVEAANVLWEEYRAALRRDRRKIGRGS